jgi:hypothetical protein
MKFLLKYGMEEIIVQYEQNLINLELVALYQVYYQVTTKEKLFEFECLNLGTDDENSPKNIVENIVQNYADKWVAKPMLYKLDRKLPINLPIPSSFLQKKSLKNLGY